jgi:two-component system, LytTR family, sensor kinase
LGNFNDKRIRLLGIFLLVLNVLYVRHVFSPPFNAHTLKVIVETIVLNSLYWEIIRWVLQQLRIKYPLLSQTPKRIALVLPLSWAGTILIDWLDMAVINLTGWMPAYSRLDFINTIPGTLVWTITIVGVQEAIYYFGRLLKAEKEAEELKQAYVQTQLDSLKQQVNPHFLFNSLTTLSHLITENAPQAERFLDEMSKVYRYLLRNNEHELIDLATELHFIRSYFHLLKTRYGDSIHLDLMVQPEHEAFLLPSHTLQLLVENAVKHNIIRKSQPLHVQIFTTASQLTVRNNLQRKTSRVLSNKVGLLNIATKFRLLQQPGIQIQETEREFAVTIPLIKTNPLVQQTPA